MVMARSSVELPADVLHPTSPLSERGRTLERIANLDAQPQNLEKHKTSSLSSGDESVRHDIDIFTGRPVFAPPEPSTPAQQASPSPSLSRSRSRSPVRHQLQQLQENDLIRVIPLDRAKGEGSDSARDLRKRLTKDTGIAVIPEQLRSALQSQTEVDIPSYAWSDKVQESAYLEELWQGIKEIHEQAELCEDELQDENGWTDVVRLVLNLALRTRPAVSEEWFQVKTINTQSIEPEFLPRITTTTPQQVSASNILTISKKADMALTLHPRHNQVSQLRRDCKLAGSHDRLRLSHMTDSYTRNIPLVLPIEIKRSDGNSEEAKLQLAVWQYGALQHWRHMSSGLGLDHWPLLLGLIVVGHHWTPYIGWRTDEQALNTCNIGTLLSTDSYHDIFTLLSLVWRILDWVEDEHWPKLVRTVAYRIQQGS